MEITQIVARLISNLKPVPLSQIPQNMLKTPVPKLSEFKKSKAGKVKEVKAKLKKQKAPFPTNKNKSLREEAAENDALFKSNISIVDHPDGIQTFQCRLCEVVFINVLQCF